jgi:hypothetical protein
MALKLTPRVRECLGTRRSGVHDGHPGRLASQHSKRDWKSHDVPWWPHHADDVPKRGRDDRIAPSHPQQAIGV